MREKKVEDEREASSDGDEERVRSDQKLGDGDAEGEANVAVPGGHHRGEPYQVEEKNTSGSCHLLGVKSLHLGSQLLECKVVSISLVGGEVEGEGLNGAISEGCKATFQLCRISQPAWEREEQR